MSSRLRPNRLNVDLQSFKQPWIDHCAAHQTTPSEAFRLIIAKLLASASEGKTVVNTSGEEDQSHVRKEIRLSVAELAAVEHLAMQEGFSATRWIVALVRARIAATPQLGQGELELLARSNMQILALGRCLNQISRMLHANPAGIAAIPPELVDGTLKAVRSHATAVAAVLAANQQRWSRK